MSKAYFSVEVVNTSYGKQYNIVDKNGIIYASAYDETVANICCKALCHNYFAAQSF